MAPIGQSLGRPDRCTFTSLTNDQRISASFGSAFTVESAHGTTIPERGTTVGAGPLTCSVTDSPVTRGGTQYVCVGWAGTGSVPSNGAGATATFELTRDSSITWLWETNYWLAITAGRGGSAGRESGWYGSGSVTSVAVADPYFQFAGWSGDTEGDTNATAMVLSMDGPRTLRARFWTEMATNNTPVPWLLAFGLTNAPNDAALSDTDKDGMPAWQEWLAGSDPTNGESSLRIVDSGTVDGSNYLTWVGGTNGARLPFTVERCTNLPSAWAPVGGAIARSTTGTNTWRRQGGADPNTFYRIKVTDPAN